MNADPLINNAFPDRMIWSRILSEAEQASAQDRFLASVIAECLN